MSETGCMTFDRWCRLNGQSALPASPMSVAKFVTDISATGVEKIWPIIGEISRAHYLIGLADPTLGGAVSAAMNAIAKIEPPRSWPKEQKFRFEQLPYDLQLYLADMMARRETELRRAQTELAQFRNKSAKESNGTSEQAA